MNWHSLFFMFFALLTCGFALAVVFASSVVRMAFYLILSLGATAGLFFLAGADHVGAMQLMIYVGGTLVLLIFGVMLTAQGPFVSLRTSGGEWILAALVGGALLVVLLQAAFSVPEWREGQIAQETVPTATPLGMGLLGVRVDAIEGGVQAAETAGEDSGSDDPLNPAAGRGGYLLPFEIVSVHLLVVLIGAAYLARTKRRVTASSPG